MENGAPNENANQENQENPQQAMQENEQPIPLEESAGGSVLNEHNPQVPAEGRVGPSSIGAGIRAILNEDEFRLLHFNNRINRILLDDDVYQMPMARNILHYHNQQQQPRNHHHVRLQEDVQQIAPSGPNLAQVPPPEVNAHQLPPFERNMHQVPPFEGNMLHAPHFRRFMHQVPAIVGNVAPLPQMEGNMIEMPPLRYFPPIEGDMHQIPPFEGNVHVVPAFPNNHLPLFDVNPYEDLVTRNLNQMPIYTTRGTYNQRQMTHSYGRSDTRSRPVTTFLDGYPVCASILASGSIPVGAVVVAHGDPRLLILGRGVPSIIFGNILPARVEVRNLCAYAGFNGIEYELDYFEVLLVLRGQANWVPANGGEIPPGSFPVGEDGFTPTYAARVFDGDEWMVGRVTEGGDACTVSADGTDYEYTYYEILVVTDMDGEPITYERRTNNDMDGEHITYEPLNSQDGRI